MYKSSGSPWFESLTLRPASQERVFCFAHAGGSSGTFRAWTKSLPALNLVGVELPGRMRRSEESLCSDFARIADELVAAITEEVHEKFVFLGHSLGALLAFEVAARLEHRHGMSPALLCLSGCQPPNRLRHRKLLSQLEDRALLSELHARNGIPSEILDDQELLMFVLPILRADITLFESYCFAIGTRVNCPVLILGGDQDPLVDYKDLVCWSELTLSSDFVVSVFPGDHFFFNASRTDVASELASQIGQRIAAPSAKGRYIR